MADMERRRSRIESYISSNALAGQKPVEIVALSGAIDLSAAGIMKECRTYSLPSNLMNESALLQNGQHALLLSFPDQFRLRLPFFFCFLFLLEIFLRDCPSRDGDG